MKKIFAFIGITLWLSAVVWLGINFQPHPIVLKQVSSEPKQVGRMFSGVLPIATNVSATTTSSTLLTPLLVKDYRNAIYSVNSNATYTLKFAGSLLDAPVDPTQAASSTNQWDYIEVVDLQNGVTIDGDTGISFTGSDSRMFEVNVNALAWTYAIITSYVSGSTTIQAVATTNE